MNVEIMKKIFISLALILSFTLDAQDKTQAIHVDVKGKGKPVLLIPGFTVPGEGWANTVAQLANNYECHVITIAGFGGTEPIDFAWLPTH